MGIGSYSVGHDPLFLVLKCGDSVLMCGDLVLMCGDLSFKLSQNANYSAI